MSKTTITLEDGYAPKRKTIARPTITFRPMLGRELLTGWGEVWFRVNGTNEAKRVRFSGAPKTWKTRATIERPIKYGMYDNSRVSAEGPDAPVYSVLGHPILVLVSKDGAA